MEMANGTKPQWRQFLEMEAEKVAKENAEKGIESAKTQKQLDRAAGNRLRGQMHLIGIQTEELDKPEWTSPDGFTFRWEERGYNAFMFLSEGDRLLIEYPVADTPPLDQLPLPVEMLKEIGFVPCIQRAIKADDIDALLVSVVLDDMEREAYEQYERNHRILDEVRKDPAYAKRQISLESELTLEERLGEVLTELVTDLVQDILEQEFIKLRNSLNGV
jgi:hypothetical protein